MPGPGGGTIEPLIRKEVPPGKEATVWDPTHPHPLGKPDEHTDAEIWRRREDGGVERGGRVHIPTDPGRDPW
jgi:hypothetical protein